MSYSPVQVANRLITLFGESGDIDPMKLQKLLYFADGWNLALTGHPLLSERPEVWRYGPVYPSVYRTFSRHGRQRIASPAPATPFGGDPELPPESPELDNLLRWIWGQYGAMSGPLLSDETHKPGTPWRNIAEKNGFQVPLGTTIPAKADWSYFIAQASLRGYQTKPFAEA